MRRKRRAAAFPESAARSLPAVSTDTTLGNRLLAVPRESDLRTFSRRGSEHFEIQDAEPLLVAEAGVYQPCRREERRASSRRPASRSQCIPNLFSKKRSDARSVVRMRRGGHQLPRRTTKTMTIGSGGSIPRSPGRSARRPSPWAVSSNSARPRPVSGTADGPGQSPTCRPTSHPSPTTPEYGPGWVRARQCQVSTSGPWPREESDLLESLPCADKCLAAGSKE